jgi:hypothetical protein
MSSRPLANRLFIHGVERIPTSLKEQVNANRVDKNVIIISVRHDVAVESKCVNETYIAVESKCVNETYVAVESKYVNETIGDRDPISVTATLYNDSQKQENEPSYFGLL